MEEHDRKRSGFGKLAWFGGPIVISWSVAAAWRWMERPLNEITAFCSLLALVGAFAGAGFAGKWFYRSSEDRAEWLRGIGALVVFLLTFAGAVTVGWIGCSVATDGWRGLQW